MGSKGCPSWAEIVLRREGAAVSDGEIQPQSSCKALTLGSVLNMISHYNAE